MQSASRFEIEGRARGRRARLEIDEHQVRWRWLEGEAPGVVELATGAPFEVVVREENRGGILSGFGVFLLALGGLWLANGSAGNGAIAVVAVAGAALVVLGLRARRTIVALRAEATAEELVCAGRARRTARAAADYLRLRHQASRREPSKTVLGFLAREARALVADRAELRNEYLALTAGAGKPELEARFVAMRRRLAALNLGWLVVVPVVVAAAVWFIPTQNGTWRGLRSLLAFLAVTLVALKLLPRVQAAMRRRL